MKAAEREEPLTMVTARADDDLAHGKHEEGEVDSNDGDKEESNTCELAADKLIEYEGFNMRQKRPSKVRVRCGCIALNRYCV